MPRHFTPGENVLVPAILASVDQRKGVVKVSIGHGVTRTVVTVSLKSLQRPIPKALVEAASWAMSLKEDDPNTH